jgi:PQQ-dependent catabolism-associated CXXCW motif protein
MKHRSALPKRLILMASLLLSSAALAEAPLFSADGYRLSHYRSPTPLSHDNARTLDTAALQQLLREQPKTRLIDVYRRQWLHGQFIEDDPHANLPNSLWLANTGDGQLTPQWQRYLREHLRQASQGNTAWPLVFYCRSDCWLGWNAIKRAHHLGYRNLYWYRDGIDAWQQAGLPLIPAQPLPLLR